MWSIDKNTSAITMHRGDTGAYYENMSRKSGSPFNTGDVAIFEVWKGKTQCMMHREFPLDDDEGAGNGRFLVAFRNGDTDTWASGTYNTEIRVALNPLYLNDKVKDGNTVRTVMKSTLTILDVNIEI